jgi:pyroglutamyl-peptidase
MGEFMNIFETKIGSSIILCAAILACGMGKSPATPAASASFAVPATDAQLAPYKVMLTSFDPFGGSAANNTQPIVAQLQTMAAAIGPNITIETCNLPVVYDVGAQTAMDCFNKIKPDAVISFGEAACNILIETAATNLDNTPGAPDNAGNERNGTPIVANGPARSGFDFPVESMFCTLPADGASVLVSRSPGNFVCNNVAYHMSQNLEPLNIPFTFIHVPSSQCPANVKDPVANAKTIATMLSAGLSNLRNAAATATLWPHPPTNSTLMPTTKTDAQTLLTSLQSANGPACELDFMNKLIASYQDQNQD